MMTAILIDGPFFLRRVRYLFPETIHQDADVVSNLAWRLSASHLFERNQPKRQLFRIYFYDVPTLNQKIISPVAREAIELEESKEERFKLLFHRKLQRKRKMTLRLGLPPHIEHWRLKPGVLEELISGDMEAEDMADGDVMPDVSPRGLELNMGVDLATLAYKQQVQQVVLVTGDGAFSSGAELLRHEGVDVVLDPMWQAVPEELFRFIDGLRSTCPPKDKAADFLQRVQSDSDAPEP